MRKLKEQEHKKIYFFTNNSGRRMQKFSGDDISEADYLIETVNSKILITSRGRDLL